MHHRTKRLGLIVGLLALSLPIGLFLARPDPIQSPVPTPIDGASIRQQRQLQNQQEKISKQSILEHDVSMTEALCRKQCLTDLTILGKELANRSTSEIRSKLLAMHKQHPHMHHIVWTPNIGNKSVAVGEIDESVRGPAKKELSRALKAIRNGERYESDTLTAKSGDAFIVLGVPFNNRNGLISLVHQDVLQRVADHQRTNLRLKEYPNDAKYGILAIDPKTGREVEVDGPEENQGISHYLRREVVVGFSEPPSEKRLQEISETIGAVTVRKLGYAYLFESDRMSTKDMIAYFTSLGVRYAEPHYIYVTNEKSGPETPQTVSAAEAEIVPNDALYRRYQWNLPIISTPAGWELTRGNEQIIVAVVDTGVTLNHPDLQGHLVNGYNVIDPEQPPEDDVGHGTHVAGVIAALTDNAEGVAGMTWHNRVMPIKVLDSTGMGSTYSVAQGLIWATDHGAKIINMSLGNYASAEFLHDAIRYAFDRDVVLIAATGNDNTSQPGFPAAYPEVFAVSATDANQQKAMFSNFGDYVDVVAPGENIASTYLDNQYAALSGTSMASPHVSALAALIRSENPSLSNTDVYEIMRQSALDLGSKGRDMYYGFGQIDVAKALMLAVGQDADTTAPPSNEEPGAAMEAETGSRTVEARPPETFIDRLFRLLFGS